jgi:hypothetical protein
MALLFVQACVELIGLPDYYLHSAGFGFTYLKHAHLSKVRFAHVATPFATREACFQQGCLALRLVVRCW